MKLFLSHDFGVTYEVALTGESLEGLVDAGEDYDREMLRWVIVDDAGKTIRYCYLHNATLLTLRAHPVSVFLTEDPYMKELIDTEGAAAVLNNDDFLGLHRQHEKGMN